MNVAPITTLEHAVEAFLNHPCTENEHRVVGLLRAAKPEVSDAAFVEYGCVEHDLVHVHDAGTWWEISRDGLIVRC